VILIELWRPEFGSHDRQLRPAGTRLYLPAKQSWKKSFLKI
jgi:hypothetical protein